MQLTGYDLVLALGGGGALGAYQGGVYEAMHEAGLQPRHIAGTSIGAFNAALIAGSDPALRIERLRSFWERMAEPLDAGHAFGPASRRVHGLMAALRARLLGRPDLYRPQFLELMSPIGGSQRLGLYDFSPALKTLAELVDLERPAREGPRLTIQATDLVTGEPVLFDSAEQPLRADHVLASASIIPDYQPLEVDGRVLCDGGFSANLPVRAVLGPSLQRPTLCIAVDLVASEAEPFWSLEGMIERKQDLHFASQVRAIIDALTAEMALAAERAGGSGPPVLLAHLVYRGREGGGSQKLYDYSRAAVHDRWRRGYEEGRAMIAALEAGADPTGPGLTIRRFPVASALPPSAKAAA